MFFVIANFLAASAARQGAQGRPRHRRPFPFLPKGDCVPLGTLPEKRENAKRKQTDKPKFETLTKALHRNPRNRPPSDKEIGTNCKSPPALRQNNRQIPLFFQFLTKI